MGVNPTTLWIVAGVNTKGTTRYEWFGPRPGFRSPNTGVDGGWSLQCDYSHHYNRPRCRWRFYSFLETHFVWADLMPTHCNYNNDNCNTNEIDVRALGTCQFCLTHYDLLFDRLDELRTKRRAGTTLSADEKYEIIDIFLGVWTV